MITASSTCIPTRVYSPTKEEVWASMYVTVDEDARALLADAADEGTIIENILVHMKNTTWLVTGVVVEQASRDDPTLPVKIKFNGALRYA